MAIILDGANKNAIYGQVNGQNNETGKLTLQVGANKGDTIDFEVTSMRFSIIAKAAGNGVNIDDFYDKNNSAVKISTAELADKLLSNIDKIIGGVDSQRANLGALQNRLESSIRNQANVSANQADARSRIRDADFAEESANLSQQSIIQQAAASMLMQANTRPQLGLSLLG